MRACPAPAYVRREMPRYIVERTFSDGLRIPRGTAAAEWCLGLVERNTEAGVTWLHSYLSEDLKEMLCVYEGPTPEAVRKSAARNHLPVERIRQVRVLDPHFYPQEEQQ
jgi:hypothetical protein